MKIQIGDQTYPARSIHEMPMQVLRELKQKYGWDVERLSAALEPMEAMKAVILAAPEEEQARVAVKQFQAFLSNEEQVEAFLLNIWMTRRAEGEDVTLEESSWFDMAGLQYIPEDGDDLGEAPVPDPRPARTASVRAGAKRPEDRKPKSTQSATSRSRSTATSA